MSALDAAVRAHARHVVAGDIGARADLAPGAEIEPGDLFERLLSGEFSRFELVAHARIGAHHILKTKYVGSTTVVVQTRWVQDPDGCWRIHEAELGRIAVGEDR